MWEHHNTVFFSHFAIMPKSRISDFAKRLTIVEKVEIMLQNFYVKPVFFMAT